jgi:hypothetical protein
VFGRLTAEGVIPPMGAPTLDVRGLGPVESALEHIAQAVGKTDGADKPAPKPASMTASSRPK